MRVLYVITKADEIGGAQIHVRDLAERLKIDDHEVMVVAGEYGAFINQLEDRGIAYAILPELVREIKPYKDLKACVLLRGIIKKFNPDLVGLHSSKAGIVGRIAALGLGIPVIFTAHGWSFTDGVGNRKRKLYIFIEKIMSHFTDKIITVSEKDKELALNYDVTTAEKQIVIHNGIIDKFKEKVPNKKVNSDSKKIIITSVARFSEQKDHETLICAMSGISNLNWELHLIGKGSRINNVELMVKEHKLEDKVFFHGEIHNVHDFLDKSDIFVLSTNWEGLPLSIIEAMCSSLPIVATNVGGVSELVTENVGFLVPRKDIQALRRALSNLIENQEMRVKMGEDARKRYLDYFCFEAMYSKTIFEYNNLIRK